MNKIKLLLLVSFLFSIQLLSAQCTPDPNCTDPEGDGEFCPTSFPSAVEDEYYEQVLTIIAPLEQQGVVLDHIQIISINNIPPGLNYQCQANDCVFYPQVAKCMNIFGTPEVDSWGNYKLYITIEVFVDVFGVVVSAGEIVDSSSVLTVLPQRYGDFAIDLEEDNVMCFEQAYQVSYIGNAAADAVYNWWFGEHLTVLSGEGQGPYMVQPSSSQGLDSITLFVEDGEYTSPVFAKSFFINTCTGVEDLLCPSLSVYPNPFAQDITCYGLGNEAWEINIFDVRGLRVHSQEVSAEQNQVYLPYLNNGVYLLSITNASQTKTLKIVKQ